MAFGKKFKDFALGKKDTGTFDKFTPLTPEQQKLNDFYNQQLKEELGRSPDAMTQSIINQNEQGLLAGANDAERQAKALVSQRGLNNSSVGLSAILGSRSGLNDKIYANRATAPILKDQFYTARLSNLMGISKGIGDIEASRAFRIGREGTGRSGGELANVMGTAGAIVGAYYGGPAGAKAGGQAGQTSGTALANF